MKILLSILLIGGGLTSGYGQGDRALQLIQIIRGEWNDFTVDNLGNLYLLDKENQLKKLTASGDSIAIFNDVRRYGNVYSIDATNPLKVLLFYKDFSTIIVLDRLLNVRNTIDLRKQNIFQVNVICASYDNGIWVYDEGEARLKHLADDGSIIGQSGDFRLQLDEAPAPAALTDQDKLVYLYDSVKGLLVFDYFGTLKNRLAFMGWQDFQVVGKFVIGRKGTILERYQLSSLQLQEKSLPLILQDARKVRIAMDRLYCLRGGRLYIYSL